MNYNNQYVKDKKFMMSVMSMKYCDKKILFRFAMKIWNNVRIQETLYNARNGSYIIALDFGTKKAFELQNLEIEISNLIFIDLKCDFNEKSFTADDLNQLQ